MAMVLLAKITMGVGMMSLVIVKLLSLVGVMITKNAVVCC